MPSKKKHGQRQGQGGGQPQQQQKKAVALPPLTKAAAAADDEKTALLPKPAGAGQEAKGSPTTSPPTTATTASYSSAPAAPAEPQSATVHHHRKPSISIIDGYNSPVRRGGPRALEVDEEAVVGGHALGLDNHDHCVIALVENEQREHLSSKVRFALRASIFANVLLSIAGGYAAIHSHSLAVFAALLDTLLDLVSQIVLFVAEHCMRQPSDERYPAGRSRMEPVGVIVVAVMMGIAAVEVLRASVTKLVAALFYHHIPTLQMDATTLAILCVAVGVKCVLYLYSSALAKESGTAEALAEDHKNDIMTNSFSVFSSTVAHYVPRAWFVDPVGAILISVIIFVKWMHVGMDHANKIVGRSAPPETLDAITELAARHHPQLELDIIRAYHFGPNFLVELEVVLPADMAVREAHDIALALQQKVEQQSFVERAFVHVDWCSRDYNEHKI